MREETETRLLADSGALVAMARSLSSSNEVRTVLKQTGAAWRRYDRRLDAHHAAMAAHGVGSSASGRSLRDLLEARSSLLSSLMDLAQVCYPQVEPVSPAVSRIRKVSAAQIGPPPSHSIVTIARWDELAD
jgi:hypothetical protein